jgi:hypothetical protein
MSRPKRTCTLPQVAPVLSEVTRQALNSTSEQVRSAFLKVSDYFKHDLSAIAAFWFSDTSLYDLQCPQHIQLLSLILESVSCQNEKAREFLDTVLSDTVTKLGIVRTMRGGVFHYRMKTGIRTTW